MGGNDWKRLQVLETFAETFAGNNLKILNGDLRKECIFAAEFQ